MIAKGTAHNNGVKLARYMITGKDGERAELWQMRGFAADNIVDAFRDVHVMAEGTRAEQPFFHVQVRNPNGEEVTRAQWERIANRIETKLGLTGQPRAIAFHTGETDGHEHMHIAWSRIDQDTMTAKRLPYFKFRLKEVSRELEIKLNLTRVRNEVESPIKYAPTRAEEEQARRLGVDIRKTRMTIRDCYDRSDCGRSFEAALAHEGLILAQGEKRDFLVIDHAGGMHALGKRILGETAREIRERLSDLDRQHLPTVEQVRAHIGEPDRSRQERKPEPVWDRDRYHKEWEDAVGKAAIEKEKIERHFVEPKPESKKDQGRREKHWPIHPPRPEPITTSSRYHFGGAARETTGDHEPQPPMPGKLRGAGAKIWEAWHQSDSARAFAAALDGEGILLAVVTKDVADRSHRLAEFAKAAGRFAPRYREGEIVAIAEPGLAYRDGKIAEPRVYKLDKRTTGEERWKVEAFLKPLDRSQLEGIEATQEKLKARAEQRIPDLQAFRDLLREMKNDERMGKAQAPGRGTQMPLWAAKRALNTVVTKTLAASRLGDKPVASAFKLLGAAGKLADGLFDLIDPPLMPALKREKEIMARTREAEAEGTTEMSKYFAEKRRQHEQEHPPDRKDRERER